ncbi:hypothetical protein PI126_g21904 [Phytophthora idaei]|nr:hypothetical protein PI126_g21904 [Phytophthora idaei]
MSLALVSHVGRIRTFALVAHGNDFNVNGATAAKSKQTRPPKLRVELRVYSYIEGARGTGF